MVFFDSQLPMGDALLAAWYQVRTRSKTAGIDGISVELFAHFLDEELKRLAHQLQQDIYHPLPALGFYRAKKSGGHRLIGIPTVRDRIVQRLLLRSLYPALEETFQDCSFAYRPGVGVKHAIERVAEVYSSQTWTVKADISQFFDSLCRTLLLSQLEELSVDQTVVRYIKGQLEAGIVVGGMPILSGRGVLQGGILSGALANLYLSEFDRRCLNAGASLTRYGDDFVIVARSLLEATRFLNLIEDWLSDIYLTLQPEKTHIFAPGEEFVFLGYGFQAGEIITPEYKQPRRNHNKKAVSVASRPPIACSIVTPTRKSLSTRNFLDSWREGMTTLYVTDQGAYVKVKHQQFQVLLGNDLKVSIPVNVVDYIILFGCCNLSHGAIGLALRRRIPILFLSYQGRYFGRLQTDGMTRVDYLSRQVHSAEDETFVLRQAKVIVAGKLHNCRILLRRLNRDRQISQVIEAIEELGVWQEKIAEVELLESLLGYEGFGTRIYFQALGALVQPPFTFEHRTRRPPTDPVNSLLSLGYTLLHQNIHSLILAVGLHPHYGNLHVPRSNHPALVSDLIEEFRAPVVDSLVIYLVNSGIFTPEDFTPSDERGGVYLYSDALKKYLKHWQDKLSLKTTHPHTGYKVSYYRCLELQVWEYISCLMGEREVYRPMKLEKW
ncbi:CRISPR-associated endonuclease Cas1 [Limnospira platensis]|uniref:CRISPR-associated endonuclease Cas1 n=1 Tax=Limnospira platensis TaxID=118562 RepID=UPI001E37F349